MLPAVAQGAIGIACREGDDRSGTFELGVQQSCCVAACPAWSHCSPCPDKQALRPAGAVVTVRHPAFSGALCNQAGLPPCSCCSCCPGCAEPRGDAAGGGVRARIPGRPRRLVPHPHCRLGAGERLHWSLLHPCPWQPLQAGCGQRMCLGKKDLQLALHGSGCWHCSEERLALLPFPAERQRPAGLQRPGVHPRWQEGVPDHPHRRSLRCACSSLPAVLKHALGLKGRLCVPGCSSPALINICSVSR